MRNMSTNITPQKNRKSNIRNPRKFKIRNVSCDSCYDLSSDHSPIILHLEKDIERNAPSCYLHNSKTDWLLFQNYVEDTIDTNDGRTSV